MYTGRASNYQNEVIVFVDICHISIFLLFTLVLLSFYVYIAAGVASYQIVLFLN